MLSGEQSNTSIVYDDDTILKLFRRLESGENPDVEIGRFLATRTRFANTPPLLGILRLDEAGEEPSVAGMLQRFVPGSVDAWRYALEHALDGYAEEAKALGRVTRALHDALASHHDDPAFAPAPIERRHVERWVESARRSVRDGLALLDAQIQSGRASAAIAEPGGRARRLIDASGEIVDRLLRMATYISSDPGLRIRHHGDYHLGQVLRTPNGELMIIDFEGEPARPLAERRARTSALRDVAGMLRSFGYAAAVMSGESDGMAQWEHEVRESFLTSYFESGDRGVPRYLPRDRDSAEAMLALFEMEKAFHELGYELNNRPDWAWIPLQAVEALTTAGGARAGGARG